MAQAKTLNKTERKQLLDVTNSCSRYPLRDSTMLLFTHLCGLRVGEVAALRFDDVLDANDTVRDEMTLDAARTKSKRARKIFLPKQIQRQLQAYVSSVTKRPQHGYLFSTQRVQGLAQTLLHSIYNACMHVLELLALRHTVVDVHGLLR
ncbi:site-specific integrase [Luminiphilus sp.]|nr:site-specific integrase [Luminiphilus sp.]